MEIQNQKRIDTYSLLKRASQLWPTKEDFVSILREKGAHARNADLREAVTGLKYAVFAEALQLPEYTDEEIIEIGVEALSQPKDKEEEFKVLEDYRRSLKYVIFTRAEMWIETKDGIEDIRLTLPFSLEMLNRAKSPPRDKAFVKLLREAESMLVQYVVDAALAGE